MNIIISMATHGDEHIGFFVRDAMRHLKLDPKQIQFITANPEAAKANTRFIESDLNRSFPGSLEGTLEERRAYELVSSIRNADIVIDIHSTTSDLKDTLIITSLNKKTLEYIQIINPANVLLMNFGTKKALISFASVGIAFEYGNDTDLDVIARVAHDIERLLDYVGITSSIKPESKKISCTSRFFDVYARATKPNGYELLPEIENYVEVKAGSNYAYNNNSQTYLTAEQDFYPILFGEKKYKTYFGFMARCIEHSKISSFVVDDLD